MGSWGGRISEAHASPLGPEQLSKTLLAWGAENIDSKAIAQAHRTSKMPFIEGHLALMPDAHFGLGSTVGSVIPTLGAIMPAAVGVDIGCGMVAVETSFSASDLPDDLGELLMCIERAVPAGVGKGHDRSHQVLVGDAWYNANKNVAIDELDLMSKAVKQFGSLGSGNHFVEVCLDPDDGVWVVLHSGSRGVGSQLARHHIDHAKGLMKERFISLEDKDLAYFVEGEPEFQTYITDLRWAQDYAFGSREAMMDATLRELEKVVDRPLAERQRINCHHNYTERENHRGKNVWVTRKGAIRARVGDMGVIPGSMGTNTFIVRGLGNPASYDSSAHGAGRTMSRTQARKSLTLESFDEAMAGKTWLSDSSKKLLDEHPDSYKDIQRVMRDQADLVEVVTELTQVLNYKGA